MAANDLCDIEVDRVERPTRPLPSAQVSLFNARVIIFSLQLFGLILGFVVSLNSGISVFITILFTWIYNAWAKNTYLGSFFMGMCRYSNAMIGWSVLSFVFVPGLVIPIITFSFVWALTNLSKFEVNGEKSTFQLLNLGLIALIATSITLVSWFPSKNGSYISIIMIFVLYPKIISAIKNPLKIKGTVKMGIFTIPLINAGISFGVNGIYEGFVILILMIFGFLFGKWYYST